MPSCMFMLAICRGEHGSGESGEKKSPVPYHILRILKIKSPVPVLVFGTVRYGDTAPYQFFGTVRYKDSALSERIGSKRYGSRIREFILLIKYLFIINQ